MTSGQLPAWAHVDTVLLDAGGVLLDLDYSYLRRLIPARVGGSRSLRTSDAELGRFEALARDEIQRQVTNGGRVSEAWRDYFHVILGQAGVPGPEQPAIIDELWAAHRRVGLWTVPVDRGPEVVRELRRRGYRLGVVSNAEGHVERDLDAAGYRGLFDAVVDSHCVGVEKPDPAIFRLALGRVGAAAERALFVGDVPAIDVQGARAAGIAPVLLDRYERYGTVAVTRLRTLDELLGLLAAPAQNV